MGILESQPAKPLVGPPAIDENVKSETNTHHDTDEDKLPTGASATVSNDGDSEGENTDPGPLVQQLDEQQNDAAQTDAGQRPDSADGLASVGVPVLPENTSRINDIRSKQTELAGHYSTLAGALAAALAGRANLSVAKIDAASLADPESTIVAEIHSSNSGLRMKKEKPLNLFKYQQRQIKSAGAINVGVIWREFYKQKAELTWRMHEEIIAKISGLEKGRLSRMRTDPGPLEVISNNLNVVRNLGSDPRLLPTNDKNIEKDMNLLRRKIAASKKDGDQSDDDDDDIDEEYPSEKEQNLHALLYEPTQEQNSCLYNLAVVAQPASDQLIDLLSVGNNELSQSQKPLQQDPVTSQPIAVQEYLPPTAQPTRYNSGQGQEQHIPVKAPELSEHKEISSAIEPQMAPGPRSNPITKSASHGPTHKRTSSQTSTRRSSSRQRKTSSKQSPPQKRPRVDHSPLVPPVQMSLMNSQMGQQMPMNQMHMQPQQVQMPMPAGMQMSMHSPQQVVTAPHQMPAISPMNPQSQLSNGVQSMSYLQPQMLPPMYQNAQQMPPQMQMAPMRMQMPMAGYGVPSGYEPQQAGMPGVPMSMYPGGMPPMMPVYGDMYFQNPMMQQMAAYPQFDDKGNAVYYSVAQSGPNLPSN